MIRSAATKLKMQRRHQVEQIKLNREIENIEGEDPCTPKKNFRNM